VDGLAENRSASVVSFYPSVPPARHDFKTNKQHVVDDERAVMANCNDYHTYCIDAALSLITQYKNLILR
jgi:hypothetical protein